MATSKTIVLETSPSRTDFHRCVTTDHPRLGRDYIGSREEVETQIREIEKQHPVSGIVYIHWAN